VLINFERRTLFTASSFSDNLKDDYPKHQQGDRTIETRFQGSELSKRGPYVIENEDTDLVLFQLCLDENLIQDRRKGLQGYPSLISVSGCGSEQNQHQDGFQQRGVFWLIETVCQTIQRINRS
jgi:hypothetical protein